MNPQDTPPSTEGTPDVTPQGPLTGEDVVAAAADVVKSNPDLNPGGAEPTADAPLETSATPTSSEPVASAEATLTDTTPEVPPTTVAMPETTTEATTPSVSTSNPESLPSHPTE